MTTMRDKSLARPLGRRGMSLPEMLVGGTLLLILLGAFASLGVNSSTEWARGSSAMAAASDAGIAIQKLGRDIRNGSRATLGANGSELTVVFPLVTASGEYDRYQDGQTVRYYLSSTVLYRQPNGGTAVALGKNLSSLSFAVNGTDIEITLTGRSTRGTKTTDTVLNTRVTLRNNLPL
jgi:type II secretory pathway pseudopilin PulG